MNESNTSSPLTWYDITNIGTGWTVLMSINWRKGLRPLPELSRQALAVAAKGEPYDGVDIPLAVRDAARAQLHQGVSGPSSAWKLSASRRPTAEQRAESNAIRRTFPFDAAEPIGGEAFYGIASPPSIPPGDPGSEFPWWRFAAPEACPFCGSVGPHVTLGTQIQRVFALNGHTIQPQHAYTERRRCGACPRRFYGRPVVRLPGAHWLDGRVHARRVLGVCLNGGLVPSLRGRAPWVPRHDMGSVAESFWEVSDVLRPVYHRLTASPLPAGTPLACPALRVHRHEGDGTVVYVTSDGGGTSSPAHGAPFHDTPAAQSAATTAWAFQHIESPELARAYARVASVVETAILRGHDPEAYLVEALAALSGTEQPPPLDEVDPRSWRRMYPDPTGA